MILITVVKNDVDITARFISATLNTLKVEMNQRVTIFDVKMNICSNLVS